MLSSISDLILETGNFLWVGGAVVSGEGIQKFSSLKGEAIPKVEGGKGFLQVNVLV